MPDALVPWPSEGGFVFPPEGDVPEFRSTLWLTPEEMATLSDEEKWDRAHQQYEVWKSVTTATAYVEPTVEALETDIESLNQQIRDLVKQRVGIEDRVAEMKNRQRTFFFVADTGVWNDPAVWAEEEGAAGGAGVPDVGDNVVIPEQATVVVPPGVGVEGRVVKKDQKPDNGD